MEPPSSQTPPAEEDEWDTEGFVIPSLGIENPEQNNVDSHKIEDSKLSSVEQDKKEENIYLGPHGAPPTQSKQELNSSSHKQRLKQKLKEADKRFSGTGRENKVDSLRELVGGPTMPRSSPKSSKRDWLDPHCHESQFERKHS